MCVLAHLHSRTHISRASDWHRLVADCEFGVVLIRDIKREYIELSVMLDYPNRPQRLAFVRDDVTPCMKFVGRMDGWTTKRICLAGKFTVPRLRIASWQIYIIYLCYENTARWTETSSDRDRSIWRSTLISDDDRSRRCFSDITAMRYSRHAVARFRS